MWSGLFSGVSFEVEPGEIVAVIGGRLEGKTTLLEVVAVLQRPVEGRVLFGGRDVWALRSSQREELIGREVVLANRVIRPKDMTVCKFIGMGLAATGHPARKIDRLAMEALERVGAAGCANSRCGDLSVSQQTLVGIARGFAVRPRLLVLDDLLDALGTEGCEEALALLHELVESKPHCGVLLSASSMEPVTMAHRIWSLQKTNGLKLEVGHSKITHIHNQVRGA